jgi:hypothetical protein
LWQELLGGEIKLKVLPPWLRGKKIVEVIYAGAKLVADTFRVIADPNRRMCEARRAKQDIHRKAGASNELLS